MNNEDKALVVGSTVAGLTAVGTYLGTGQSGIAALAGVIIIAVAAFLKGYIKAPAPAPVAP